MLRVLKIAHTSYTSSLFRDESVGLLRVTTKLMQPIVKVLNCLLILYGREAHLFFQRLSILHSEMDVEKNLNGPDFSEIIHFVLLAQRETFYLV